MSKKPLVCIIALTWNNKRMIKQCLTSIYKHTDYQNYKIIVVENGSTKDCAKFTQKNFPKADVLHLVKNRGFSGGNNYGIKYAIEKYHPKYIMLISNDIEIVQKDWLTQMVEVEEQNSNIGLESCKLLYPDGTIQHAGINAYRIVPLPEGCGEEDQGQYDYIKTCTAAIGALCLIPSKVIEKVGLLDELFIPGFLEDLDYSIRVRQSGFTIAYNGLVKAIHYEGITWGKKYIEQDNKFFVSQRNTFLFTFRHFPLSYQMLRIFEGAIFSFLWKKPKAKLSIRSIRPQRNFLYRFFLILGGLRWALIHKNSKPIYPKINK